MLSRRLCEREMLSPPRFPVPPKKVSQMQGHTGGTPATSLYHGVHVFASTADWVQFVFPCSTGRRPCTIHACHRATYVVVPFSFPFNFLFLFIPSLHFSKETQV